MNQNTFCIAEKGALERYFRISEGKMRDGVCAIPIETLRLRLYCLRISDEILILVSGGLKESNLDRAHFFTTGKAVRTALELFDL